MVTAPREQERIRADLRYALHATPALSEAQAGAWWQLVRVRQQPRRRVALKALVPVLIALGILFAPLAAPAVAPPPVTAATLAPVEAPPPAAGAAIEPFTAVPTATPPQTEPVLPSAVPVP